MTDWIELFI